MYRVLIVQERVLKISLDCHEKEVKQKAYSKVSISFAGETLDWSVTILAAVPSNLTSSKSHEAVYTNH